MDKGQSIPITLIKIVMHRLKFCSFLLPFWVNFVSFVLNLSDVLKCQLLACCFRTDVKTCCCFVFPGSSEDDLHLSGFGQEELSWKRARPRPAGRRSPHTGQVCAAPMSTGGNVGVGICSQSCLRQRCVCVTVATLTCGGPTCTWTLPWREQAAAAPPAPAPPALREAPTSAVSHLFVCELTKTWPEPTKPSLSAQAGLWRSLSV